MNAYAVVEQFEQELCRYTGAPYCVTTNSGTMAIFLALQFHFPVTVRVPSRTYCSVPMAVRHAGHKLRFEDFSWSGQYDLYPLPVYDAARRFTANMYPAGTFQCVSFQTSKILGLEQGGAILHDNAEADEWLRRARFDGRLNAEEKLPKMIGHHCYLSPTVAALGLQRLACLPRDNPDQAGAADFADLSELPCFR